MGYGAQVLRYTPVRSGNTPPPAAAAALVVPVDVVCIPAAGVTPSISTHGTKQQQRKLDRPNRTSAEKVDPLEVERGRAALEEGLWDRHYVLVVVVVLDMGPVRAGTLLDDLVGAACDRWLAS